MSVDKKNYVLVSDWWPVYVRTYLPRASEQTRRDYDNLYRRHIAPYIGCQPLKSTQPAEIQELLNNLSSKSSSLVRKAVFLLRGLFRTAEENGYIDKSPFRGIVIPEAESGSRRALTEAERALFLQAASQCGVAGQFYAFMYHTGLRPSEVARVQGRDIDPDQRLLSVRGSKTKAATRLVPIPNCVILPQKKGLLFTTSCGNAPDKDRRQKWWNAIKRQMQQISGRPVAPDLTAYCLRHDYCTRLSEAGVPIETASRIMGHSDIQLTAKIYQEQNRPELQTALSRLDAAASCSGMRLTDSDNKKAARDVEVSSGPVDGASERIRTSNLLIRRDVERASEEWSSF